MAPEVSARDAGGAGKPGEPAELPARILAVATRLFAEHGWAGTHVRGIAEEAGCTPTAVYYHFAGKEALWTRAVEAGHRRLEDLQRSLADVSSVRARLLGSLTALVTLAEEEPHSLWLLYRAGRHAEEGQPSIPADRHREAVRQATASVLERGIESGELRADLDVDAAVTLVHGMMDHRLADRFYEGRPIGERWPERAVELMLGGLGS